MIENAALTSEPPPPIENAFWGEKSNIPDDRECSKGLSSDDLISPYNRRTMRQYCSVRSLTLTLFYDTLF
jgi:hypothetical protein